MKRDVKKSVRVFCLNDPVEAEEYSNLLNNPRIALVHITDNWDKIGNFRIVASIEEDIDKRPLPTAENEEFGEDE